MSSRRTTGRLSLLLVLLLLAWPAQAPGHGPDGHQSHHDAAPTAEEHAGHGHSQPMEPSPEEKAVNPALWVEEKTGATVPLDLEFRNERGERVSLRQLIDRPILLLPVYYRCPTGCSFELANLADAIRRSRHRIDSFRAISLSFDAEETPAVAAQVRPNYVALLGKDFPQDAWVFLTGDSGAIARLTQAVGFAFQKKDDGTFVHPSALVALDRNGRIIKYVYGSFISGDVDLALAEAAKGTPASSIRRLLEFCFPANPRQTQQVLTVLKIGSGVLLVLGGIGLALFLRRKPTDQPKFDP
ncbi:MAG: SCO family protein [Desulfobulbus sp.]|jgi:protein SCO1/2|uniref:SCO family protein n=1 Tax=Desulfobulbus sp. TaxID=895 RepID=UPI00284856E3|nr:SCO family protein [Desulfobulbus sp.]MDR2549298.1 SCO family protein [Desulfobulbus sp.]